MHEAPADDRRAWNIAVIAVSALTLLRLYVLFASPLELYPDEAQYWLWSRDLAFGYVSKPPMVAWLIHLTTVMGRDAEPFVRLSSPLMHAGAGLCLFAVGRSLYDARTGLAALALYELMPGVQISSFVVSTDAALLFFLSLALVFYAGLQTAEDRRAGLFQAAGFGVALGLAALSKYAALYALIGVACHLALAPDARAAWRPGRIAVAVLAFAAIIAPNIAWNAVHHFATVTHTAANADWRSRGLFSPASLGVFVASQFGVFGPVPFAVLLGGGGWLVVRRRVTPQDALLLCFVLPPLLIVTAQSFISRANANWAAAAYAPAAILVAAWLLRWRARPWLIAALVLQGAVAVGALVVLAKPDIADRIGAANSLKRMRGWREATALVVDRAKTESLAGPLSAVAVDDRFLFNAAAYYGRDYFGTDGPPLRFWTGGEPAANQAALQAPLTVAEGARVLGVSYEGRSTAAMEAGFEKVQGRQIDSLQLDRKHRRRIDLFLGEGYRGPGRP